MAKKIKNVSENLDLSMYVDRLVTEKKYPENLEKEVIDQIKKDLLSRVEDTVNMVIISNLSEEKLEEFNKLMDSNISDEEMQKFCSDSIPQLPQLIASELIVFKQTYLS
jgi:broad-specificity NMP kinase